MALDLLLYIAGAYLVRYASLELIALQATFF